LEKLTLKDYNLLYNTIWYAALDANIMYGNVVDITKEDNNYFMITKENNNYTYYELKVYPKVMMLRMLKDKEIKDYSIIYMENNNYHQLLFIEHDLKNNKNNNLYLVSDIEKPKNNVFSNGFPQVNNLRSYDENRINRVKRK